MKHLARTVRNNFKTLCERHNRFVLVMQLLLDAFYGAGCLSFVAAFFLAETIANFPWSPIVIQDGHFLHAPEPDQTLWATQQHAFAYVKLLWPYCIILLTIPTTLGLFFANAIRAFGDETLRARIFRDNKADILFFFFSVFITCILVEAGLFDYPSPSEYVNNIFHTVTHGSTLFWPVLLSILLTRLFAPVGKLNAWIAVSVGMFVIPSVIAIVTLAMFFIINQTLLIGAFWGANAGSLHIHGSFLKGGQHSTVSPGSQSDSRQAELSMRLCKATQVAGLIETFYKFRFPGLAISARIDYDNSDINALLSRRELHELQAYRSYRDANLSHEVRLAMGDPTITSGRPSTRFTASQQRHLALLDERFSGQWVKGGWFGGFTRYDDGSTGPGIVILLSGTDPMMKRDTDWGSDVLAVIGAQPGLRARALNALSAFPEEHLLVAYGHSLGGMIASSLRADRVITFGSPPMPLYAADVKGDDPYAATAKRFEVAGDIVPNLPVPLSVTVPLRSFVQGRFFAAIHEAEEFPKGFPERILLDDST